MALVIRKKPTKRPTHLRDPRPTIWSVLLDLLGQVVYFAVNFLVDLSNSLPLVAKMTEYVFFAAKELTNNSIFIDIHHHWKTSGSTLKYIVSILRLLSKLLTIGFGVLPTNFPWCVFIYFDDDWNFVIGACIFDIFLSYCCDGIGVVFASGSIGISICGFDRICGVCCVQVT